MTLLDALFPSFPLFLNFGILGPLLFGKLPNFLCVFNLLGVLGFVFGELPLPAVGMYPFEKVPVMDFFVVSNCSVGGIIECSAGVGGDHTFSSVDALCCALSVFVSCCCCNVPDALIIGFCKSGVGEVEVPAVNGGSSDAVRMDAG